MNKTNFTKAIRAVKKGADMFVESEELKCFKMFKEAVVEPNIEGIGGESLEISEDAVMEVDFSGFTELSLNQVRLIEMVRNKLKCSNIGKIKGIPAFIFDFDVIGSTHLESVELFDSVPGNNYCCMSALHQNGGIGRSGNKWLSGKENMALTISFSSQFKNYPLLEMILTSCAIEACGIEELQVKWPNDVYFKEKKLAGCIVNVNQIGNKKTFICSIGLNLNSAVGSETISLKDILGKHIERSAFIEAYIKLFIEKIENFDKKVFLSQLNRKFLYLGSEVNIFSADMKEILAEGRFKGLSATGEAFLEKEGKINKISSGRMRLKELEIKI